MSSPLVTSVILPGITGSQINKSEKELTPLKFVEKEKAIRFIMQDHDAREAAAKKIKATTKLTAVLKITVGVIVTLAAIILLSTSIYILPLPVVIGLSFTGAFMLFGGSSLIAEGIYKYQSCGSDRFNIIDKEAEEKFWNSFSKLDLKELQEEGEFYKKTVGYNFVQTKILTMEESQQLQEFVTESDAIGKDEKIEFLTEDDKETEEKKIEGRKEKLNKNINQFRERVIRAAYKRAQLRKPEKK